MRLTPLLIGLLVGALALAGCQESTVSPAENQSSGSQDNDQEPDDDDPEQNHNDHQHHGDDDGHGPDPDAVKTDIAPVTGSWRVARAEDDAPVVYLDLLVSAEETDDMTGHFIMGLAPAEMLDGNRGDVVGGSYEDGVMVVEWNPTAQDTELYRITTTDKVDDDNFNGVFTAEHAPLEFEVSLSRRVFDDDEE